MISTRAREREGRRRFPTKPTSLRVLMKIRPESWK
jgi:hypothetical protein